MNPPVGPRIIPMPPVKLANMGTPAAPSRTYASVEKNPPLAPNTTPASDIANVCIVIGTPSGIGILICAITAIRAVNIPILQISLVFSFFKVASLPGLF